MPASLGASALPRWTHDDDDHHHPDPTPESLTGMPQETAEEVARQLHSLSVLRLWTRVKTGR